jgi:hypothetical protein
VWLAPDLIWLNIATQVLNAFLLPLMIGFLVLLAMKALPVAFRPSGAYVWALVGLSAIVSAVGVFSALYGL